ncbi:DUF6941 family protein [Actinokineospora enzanensis]|uniref:DUF6941 family protein n=1 Tax=Actinokineospora enzanensis TaxID=155975 RepID=UPI00146A35BD|nr:hypothetical protein [Actinokineospora enzanensis]
MAGLDFAMLAEFARVDSGGLLTVVGGGFDRMEVRSSGLVQQVHLVMRFNLGDGETSVGFGVRVLTPGDPVFQVEVSGLAVTDNREADAPVARHAVTVIPLGFPVAVSGSYALEIQVDGQVVGSLPFEVRIVAGTAS